jgi:hypothetical protein
LAPEDIQPFEAVAYLLKNAAPERQAAVVVNTLEAFQSSAIDLANRQSSPHSMLRH